MCLPAQLVVQRHAKGVSFCLLTETVYGLTICPSLQPYHCPPFAEPSDIWRKMQIVFFFLHLPVTCLRRGSEYFPQHPKPLFFHQEVSEWVSERERERVRFTRALNTRSKCNFVSLRFLDTAYDKKLWTYDNKTPFIRRTQTFFPPFSLFKHS